MEKAAIPVIEVDKFAYGTVQEKEDVGRLVRETCLSTGFMYVKSELLSQNDIQLCLDYMKGFFNLPHNIKQDIKYQFPPDNKGWWLGFYSQVDNPKYIREQASEGEYPESFSVSREGTKPHALRADFYNNMHIPTSQWGFGATNLWPDDECLRGFRAWCVDYYERNYTLCAQLLRIIAFSLGIDEEYFLPAHNKRDSILNLKYYPAHESSDDTAVRLQKHTDFSTITIVAQDSMGGLQVERPDATWQDIPPIPGTLVVNVGDTLMRWTNYKYKSTVHRVVRNRDNSKEGRYSAIFFMSADWDAQLVCPPGLQDEQGTREKETSSFVAGNFIMNRLAGLDHARPVQLTTVNH